MKKEIDETIEVISSLPEEDFQVNQGHLWTIIDSYAKQNGMAAHQIRSYHSFLEEIRSFLREEAKIELKVEPQFKETRETYESEAWSFTFEEPISFSLPMHLNSNGEQTLVTPMMCRLRNLSYYTKLTANLHLSRKVEIQGEMKVVEQEIIEQLQICRLPVMIGSKLCYTYQASSQQKIGIQQCPLDQGGYFICEGNEKVIIGQERSSQNEVIVRKTNSAREPWISEILSRGRGHRLASDLFRVILKPNNERELILCKHRFLSSDMPLSLLLRALGLSNDIQIIQAVCGVSFFSADDLNQEFVDKIVQILRHSLELGIALTPEESLITLGKYITFNKDKEAAESCFEAAIRFVKYYLLNHLGIEESSFLKKAYFTGYMVRRLIQGYLNGEKDVDYEHLGRKRVDLSGRLLMDVFVFEFRKKYVPHVISQLRKSISSDKLLGHKRMNLIFDSRIITTAMTNALKTGSWSFRPNGSNRVGISLPLKRDTNYLSTIAHVRKVSGPYFSESRNTSSRLLHNTHFGMFCPSETPEGKKIGIIKNLAFLTIVSNKLSEEDYRILLRSISESQEQRKEVVKNYDSARKENLSVIKENHRVKGEESTAKKEVTRKEKRKSKSKGRQTKVESQTLKNQEQKIKSENSGVKAEQNRCKFESIRIKRQSEMFFQEPEMKGLPSLYSTTKIFVDGDWLSNTREAISCVNRLRELRRKNSLNYQISINYQPSSNQIHIHTDDGRCMRPLLVVEYNAIKLQPQDFQENTTFEELRQKGFIEYLDVEEEENSLIAMDPSYLKNNKIEYTHCEIHPSMIFGVCASIIPFSNHNQATKNTLQSAMAKQAMGCGSTNMNLRMDAINYSLFYPQQPLVTTKQMAYVSTKALPIGSNPIVAMSTFSGYSQFDSVTINQSAIQRGLFRSVNYHSFEAEESVALFGGEKTIIAKPSYFFEDGKWGKMQNLDQDGLPFLARFYDEGQIAIGNVKLKNRQAQVDQDQTLTKDVSVRIRRGEQGYIQKVLIAENAHGFKLAKIKTRSVKIPKVGDKFASRHGQKGICGMTYRQEDLPFTVEGLVPDMIVNPHCIPARMTIGHIFECLMAKFAAVKGVTQDGTAFKQWNIEKMADLLHSSGYQRGGSQAMINPQNGLCLESLTFIGPIYYQRLRHLVDDKIYSRSRGVISALTRQPAKGRCRGGGIRFGQMQRDCLLSHGLTEMLRERLFTSSDFFKIVVCGRCGMMVNCKMDRPQGQCRKCGKAFRAYEVEIPYATKLLIQQLLSMHVLPRIQFKKGK